MAGQRLLQAAAWPRPPAAGLGPFEVSARHSRHDGDVGGSASALTLIASARRSAGGFGAGRRGPPSVKRASGRAPEKQPGGRRTRRAARRDSQRELVELVSDRLPPPARRRSAARAGSRERRRRSAPAPLHRGLALTLPRQDLRGARAIARFSATRSRWKRCSAQPLMRSWSGSRSTAATAAAIAAETLPMPMPRYCWPSPFDRGLGPGEGRDQRERQAGQGGRTADRRFGIEQAVAHQRHEEAERDDRDAELEHRFPQHRHGGQRGEAAETAAPVRRSDRISANARDEAERDPFELLAHDLDCRASEPRRTAPRSPPARRRSRAGGTDGSAGAADASPTPSRNTPTLDAATARVQRGRQSPSGKSSKARAKSRKRTRSRSIGKASAEVKSKLLVIVQREERQR